MHAATKTFPTTVVIKLCVMKFLPTFGIFLNIAQTIFILFFFSRKLLCFNFDQKMVLAAFWAIFLQTHLAPLPTSGVDVMITIFCDFCQISAKKMAFFSKTNVTI
jgi:hypothetical protein